MPPMMRARRTITLPDDEGDDGVAVPTWIMGIPYTELREEERRLDVFSTMWITYRSGFPKMEPYGYTDDSGWGCMLRSAQMLMTQALQRHTLGRSWRVPRTLEERLLVPEYRSLVRLFADHPGEGSLFSIHNMCQVGIRYDKLPGEWYGPTTAACVLRDISELHAARLSGSRLRKPESSRCPPPPLLPSPSEPLSSTANAEPVVAAASPGLRAGVSTEGVEVGGGEAATRGDRVVAPAAVVPVEGGKGAQRGGQRGAKRPCSASPVENGQANGSGGDSERSCGSGESSVAFPSSRPLRVFVSQGDVVYIDEVEAAATRGHDNAAAPAAAAAAAANGDSTAAANGGGGAGGDGKAGTGTGALADVARSGEKGNKTSGLAAAGGAPQEQGRRSEAAENSGKVNEDGGPSPAFFDPLLNPGSGEGWNRAEEAWSSAVVLLVPLRLGLDELSAGYIPSLLEMLRVPQSLGFLGGRPNHAIYFIGAQGNTLTGLDPHTTQAAPDMGGAFPSERYLHSLHCQSAVSMDVHRIDPSLALAFYLPNRASFRDLTKKIAETNPNPFSVEQTRPDYEGEMGLAFMINQRDDDGTTDDDDDEYVFVKGPER